MGGVESELGELDAADAAPPKPRDDKGKFVPSKTDDKADKAKSEKPAAKVEKPAAKSETQPAKDETQPAKGEEAAVEPQKAVRAAELRTAYDSLKKKFKEELEPELQRLRSKVTEYEQKGFSDPAPLAEKIKTLETENASLKNELAFHDESKSPDFIKNYEEPYQNAWKDAVETFAELDVRVPDGEDELGEPKFTYRKADANDLTKLAVMKLADLDKAAQEMFGASNARALIHVENIRRLARKHRDELDRLKSTASQTRAERELRAKEQAKHMSQAWIDTNKALEAKYPKAYTPEEGNADDKAAHTKGFALADLLFIGRQGLRPEQIEELPPAFRDTLKANKDLSPVQTIRLTALARLKMANHDRKVAALKKANARIAELEKSLAEYEKSEPSSETAGDSSGRDTGKSWEETVEAEIKALDK